MVAIGTPEEVAETPESYTGEWLRHVLGLKGKATGTAPTVAAVRAAKANGAAKPNGTSKVPARPATKAPTDPRHRGAATRRTATA